MEDQISELEGAIREKNYARAVTIAESKGYPKEEIKKLQREALKEFILENRNPQGAHVLAEEYHFNQQDRDQLLREILEEARQKGLLEKRQYDIKTKRYLTLEEWVREYFKDFQSRP
ncbi:MAG: hypothetical protein ACPL6D_04615 [Thermodesulfobacteriota bacterium]